MIQEKNAVFCDFLSLCPHILPYTYREPQAEKQSLPFISTFTAEATPIYTTLYQT